MIAGARFAVLVEISAMEVALWKKLRSESTGPSMSEQPTTKDIVDELQKLEGLRQSIQAHRISIVPWDAFCAKIIVPILIGVAVFACQIRMKHEAVTSQTAAPSATTSSASAATVP
jgi:hypothetical protein